MTNALDDLVANKMNDLLEELNLKPDINEFYGYSFDFSLAHKLPLSKDKLFYQTKEQPSPFKDNTGFILALTIGGVAFRLSVNTTGSIKAILNTASHNIPYQDPEMYGLMGQLELSIVHYCKMHKLCMNEHERSSRDERSEKVSDRC